MARYRYNPYTRTWAQGTPQRNPITKKFESAAISSRPVYNRPTRSYVLAAPGSVSKYNPYTRRWEQAAKNSRLVYNRYTRSYEYKI